MSKTETVYPKGIRTFAKSAKQPDFVLGEMVMSIEEFKDWLIQEADVYFTKYQGKDQLRFQIIRGRDGKPPYLTVNTFKPKAETEQDPLPAFNPVNDAGNSDDLPF